MPIVCGEDRPGMLWALVQGKDCPGEVVNVNYVEIVIWHELVVAEWSYRQPSRAKPINQCRFRRDGVVGPIRFGLVEDSANNRDSHKVFLTSL